MPEHRFTLNFFDELVDDVGLLPDHIKPQLAKYLGDLERVGLRVGTKLEKRYGRDLSMCYKIYFDEARYRIVYKANDNDPENVIDIIAIQRKTEVLYDEVLKRIEKK